MPTYDITVIKMDQLIKECAQELAWLTYLDNVRRD